MLQRNHNNRSARTPLLRPALRQIKLVLTFVLQKLVSKSWPQFLFVAILGTGARFLSLATLVIALKGFIVALNPEHFAKIAQNLFSPLGYTAAISKIELISAIVLALVTISLLAFVAHYARGVAIRALMRRFLDSAVEEETQLNISTDEFMINRVAPSIDIIVKLIEIVIFSGLVCLCLALISPSIALFLLPVLAIIPLAVLFASRHSLRLADKRVRAHSNYKSTFPKKTDDASYIDKWINTERKDYITARFNTQQQQLQSQQYNNLILAAALSFLMLYVSFAGIESVDMLSVPLPLIFIVLALRQMLIYAKEFGMNFSKLMDLRQGVNKYHADDEE